MIDKIHHVGIAVRSIAERLPFWQGALGLVLARREVVDTEGVEVCFLEAGEARIELLEPTRPDSAVARHLEKRGEGIQHVTLAVPDLDAALARLSDSGVDVVGGGPRVGSGGHRIAFLHPRSSGGVLVELVERADHADAAWHPHAVDGPETMSPALEGPWPRRPVPAAPTAPRAGGFEPGSPVLAYLRDPHEKLWGVLRRLDPAGLVLDGIDLGSFDDWIAQVERGDRTVVGPSPLFLPMLRLERLLVDRAEGEIPSMAERFQRRIGRSVLDILGG